MFAASLGPAIAAERPPNIVHIYADDLGYGDLGVFGSTVILTPRLDAMAKGGMKMTRHYTTAPVCAPARCGLLTGLHNGNTRVTTNSGEPLRAEDLTIAEVLKKRGYRTGCFGKWGLGGAETSGAPWKKGFDQFFGFLSQTEAHRHYPEELDDQHSRYVLEGNAGGGRKTYAPDIITERALEFIRQSKDQPFYLYFATTLPHAENAAPPEVLEKYRGKFRETPFPGEGLYGATETPNAAYAAMVTRLDEHVGQIIDLIKNLGLEENTLIVFSSDNGPHNAGGHDLGQFNSTAGLRERKRSVHEGGIRSPFIAYWPSKIPAGSTSERMTAGYDLFPTFAEAAGAKVPETTDGTSFLRTLLGQEQPEPEFLYWEFANNPKLPTGWQQALRQGDWKFVQVVGGKPQLYNLAEDPREKVDLAEKYPERVDAMLALVLGQQSEAFQKRRAEKNP